MQLKFTKEDLGKMMALKRIISTSKLELKGDAVVAVSSIFAWYESMIRSVEEGLKEDAKDNTAFKGKEVMPINDLTTTNDIVGGTDGTIIGNTDDRLKVDANIHFDDVTGGVIVADIIHQRIHEGVSYVTGESAVYGNGDEKRFCMTSPNTTTRIHLRLTFRFSGRYQIELFENPTLTEGTALTILNRDRNSSNTATATVKNVTAVTSDGNRLINEYGGSTGLSAARINQENIEIILKQNEQYLLRIISDDPSNRITWQLNWYEAS